MIGHTVVVVNVVKLCVDVLGWTLEWLWPVPDGIVVEDEVIEEPEELDVADTLWEVEPVAHEDFPYQASVGTLVAAAEPTRAARKMGRDVYMADV